MGNLFHKYREPSAELRKQFEDAKTPEEKLEILKVSYQVLHQPKDTYGCLFCGTYYDIRTYKYDKNPFLIMSDAHFGKCSYIRHQLDRDLRASIRLREKEINYEMKKAWGDKLRAKELKIAEEKKAELEQKKVEENELQAREYSKTYSERYKIGEDIKLYHKSVGLLFEILENMGFVLKLSQLSFDPLFDDMKIGFNRNIVDVRCSTYLVEALNKLIANKMAYISIKISYQARKDKDGNIIKNPYSDTYYSMEPIINDIDAKEIHDKADHSALFISDIGVNVHTCTTEKGKKYLEDLLDKGIYENIDKAAEKYNEKHEEWMNKMCTACTVNDTCDTRNAEVPKPSAPPVSPRSKEESSDEEYIEEGRAEGT